MLKGLKNTRTKYYKTRLETNCLVGGRVGGGGGMHFYRRLTSPWVPMLLLIATSETETVMEAATFNLCDVA